MIDRFCCTVSCLTHQHFNTSINTLVFERQKRDNIFAISFVLICYEFKYAMVLSSPYSIAISTDLTAFFNITLLSFRKRSLLMSSLLICSCFSFSIIGMITFSISLANLIPRNFMFKIYLSIIR